MADVDPFMTGADVLKFFKDPAFQAILKQFMTRCVSWEEFISFPMPLSLSPLATWEIIQQISRCIGVDLPIPDLNDQEYWYLRTYELTDTIQKVTRACGVDSRLYRSMAIRDNQKFLMNVRIDETIAAVRLDGICVNEKDLENIFNLKRNPESATEQLLLNNFNLASSIENFAGEPFSHELCKKIHNFLIHDVNIDEIEMSKLIPLGTGLFEWKDELVEKYADRQLNYILGWANHDTGSIYDHQVLRALLLPDAFRFYRPFKFMSYQIGRLLGYIYALKHDLPVLNLLPASCVKLEWDMGTIKPPLVDFDRPTFENLRWHSGGNLTCMQTIVAQLMLIALEIVELYVSDWENCDAELQKVLKKDSEINYRQHCILNRAMRKPRTEFTISCHKDRHDIAYPTARADFLELVKKGYLVQRKKGKTFIFMASKTLEELSMSQQNIYSMNKFSLLKNCMNYLVSHRNKTGDR